MKTVGMSPAAAQHRASVEQLNTDFNVKIQYPGPVYAIDRIAQDDIWSRMISQGLGHWNADAPPRDPSIWVAG